MSSYDKTVTRGIYLAVLQDDVFSPFVPKSDEEPVKDDEPAADEAAAEGDAEAEEPADAEEAGDEAGDETSDEASEEEDDASPATRIDFACPSGSPR